MEGSDVIIQKISTTVDENRGMIGKYLMSYSGKGMAYLYPLSFKELDQIWLGEFGILPEES